MQPDVPQDLASGREQPDDDEGEKHQILVHEAPPG
jgi:hypothetical protein